MKKLLIKGIILLFTIFYLIPKVYTSYIELGTFGYKFTVYKNNNIILFQTKKRGGKGKKKLIVTRYNSEKNIIWEKDFTLIKEYISHYSLKKRFVTITKDKVLFPILKMNDSEDFQEIQQVQICLNLETGDLMWRKNIPLNSNNNSFNELFYSTTDKKSIYIHSFNHQTGPQIISLDLQTGKQNWNSLLDLESPHWPLQSNNYFILHNKNEDQAALIEKKSGKIKLFQIYRPGILYKNSFIISKKNNKRINLYKIDLTKPYSQLVVPKPFKSLDLKIEKSKKRHKVFNFATYKNRLIYIISKNKIDQVIAFSLNNSKKLWEIKIPAKYTLDIYKYGSVIKPEYESFYEIKNRFLPLCATTTKKIMENKKVKQVKTTSRLLVIDLDAGKIEKMHKSIIRDSFDIFVKKNKYYFVYKNSNNKSYQSSLVSINGESGKLEYSLKIVSINKSTYTDEEIQVYPDSFHPDYTENNLHYFTNDNNLYVYDVHNRKLDNYGQKNNRSLSAEVNTDAFLILQ